MPLTTIMSDQQQQQQSRQNIFEVEITNDNALSILHYFLDLGAKRGAYSLTEASRIMETLKYIEKRDAGVEKSDDVKKA